MPDIMDNPRLREDYQNNIKMRFKSHYCRDPIGDEAMIYAMAAFFVDNNSPGYTSMQNVIAYGATVMKLWKTHQLSSSEVLEAMIHVIAQIVQIGAEEKAKYEQAKKEEEERLLAAQSKKDAEDLAKKLPILELEKN